MPDEPSAAGTPYQQSFPGMGPGTFTGGGPARTYGASAGIKLDFGTEKAAAGFAGLNQEISTFQSTLKDLSSQQYLIVMAFSSMFERMRKEASSTAVALREVSSAAAGIGGGGMGGGGGVTAIGPAMPSGGGGGWFSGAAQSATAAIGAAGGGAPPLAIGTGGGAAGGAGGGKGGGGAGGLLGGGGGSMGNIPIVGDLLSMAGDLSMLPMRVMREKIQNNRQTALFMSQGLGGMAFASGRASGSGMQNMLGNLINMPGGTMGTTQDLMAMLEVGRQSGATFGFGGQQGVRAPGYLKGLQEMQRMTPGTPLSDLSQQLGGQSANIASQQMSVVMTSGAFSMIKGGGKQKSASEWAESILRWLEGQRPGRDRGKPFDYGQLLAQHFPGSNIDSWLTVNGISPDMKEVFWNYAEGKAKKTGSSQGDFKVEEPRGALAYERLRSENEITRGETGLASRMSGQYANREVVNKWFNSMQANLMNRIIPAATGPGSPLSIIQYLPDFIEDMLYSMLENSGVIGQVLGGNAFNLAGMVGTVQNAGQAIAPTATGANSPSIAGIGDIGDIGDYGPRGGTTSAGLTPDMRRKVDKMMSANPNLRINSGFRDRATQMRLHRKGVGGVSSGPSAHTRGMAADIGPRSEYDWLTQNAGKFGLSSGASKGEPWHIGMGDIGDIIPDLGPISDAGGFLLDKAEGIPIIGGAVSAARSVDDIIGMLGKMFGGFFESMKSMGGLLTSGMFGMQGLLSGKGDIGSFLGSNITDFQNLLLGPFGKFGAGEAGQGQAFNASFGKSLPTDIKLGGAYTPPGLRADKAYGGGIVGGALAGAAAAGGGAPTGSNQAIGQQMAATYGWTGANWTALQELWQGESGWDHTADNPNSSAYGIPQALPGSKMSSAGADWKTNPATQIKWGLEYIKGRYGSPSAALSKWKSRSPHWYAGGAWSTNTEMAQLHQDEMVLPATIAENVRQSLNGGGSAGVVFHNTFHISGGNGGMGGSTIDMQRTVMTLADHLEAEMKRRGARV